MSSDLFREEALEYQSASNARFGKPTGVIPPAWSRITMLLALFMAALIVFLLNVDFARKETVRGKLRVDGAEARIYALELGLITKVMVDDGQLVQAGDPIAEITTERFMSDGGAVSDATLAQLERERKTLERRRQATLDTSALNVAATDQKYANAKRQEQELATQYEVMIGRVEIARRRAEEAKEFLAEGLIAEPQMNERLDMLGALEQSRLQLRAQVSAASSAQTQARLEKQQVRAALKSDLADLDQRLGQIEAQMEQTDASASYTLRASIDGKVTALQARVGEQSINGAPLAIILPENSVLIAEVYIPSRAIGFVEPGKQVKLQYDAFPYQKFGIAYGKISNVASAAQLPQEIGINSQTGEPVYRVGIRLETQSVEAFARDMPLQAGMELTADIVLENRRLVEWLLEPLANK